MAARVMIRRVLFPEEILGNWGSGQTSMINLIHLKGSIGDG